MYDCLSKFGRDGEMDLMSFVRQAMFDSVMRELYGSKNLPQTETGMRELEHKFVKYSEGLENVIQPPEFLFRLVQSLLWQLLPRIILIYMPCIESGVAINTGYLISSRRWWQRWRRSQTMRRCIASFPG